MRRFSVIIMTMVLSGCVFPETADYGTSMKEFYAEHPKVTKLENKTAEYTVYFTRAGMMTEDAQVNMQDAFADITPAAAESVMISVPKAADRVRTDQIVRQLRNMGYPGKVIMREINPEIARDTAEIVINYVSVVLPDCPNWRKSSQHNYSNTLHSNMRCATENNLAAQVADPRDLRGNKARTTMSGERNGVAIQTYNSGKDITGIGTSGSTGSAGGSSSSSSASSAGTQ